MTAVFSSENIAVTIGPYVMATSPHIFNRLSLYCRLMV